jgi:hypothetical protein
MAQTVGIFYYTGLFLVRRLGLDIVYLLCSANIGVVSAECLAVTNVLFITCISEIHLELLVMMLQPIWPSNIQQG